MDIREKRLYISFRFTEVLVFILIITAIGCEKFYEPDLGMGIESDEFYTDASEYRAASMGLYGLQQELVEQLVVLGELRGDLLNITPNADADLIEINNFQA